MCAKLAKISRKIPLLFYNTVRGIEGLLISLLYGIIFHFHLGEHMYDSRYLLMLMVS